MISAISSTEQPPPPPHPGHDSLPKLALQSFKHRVEKHSQITFE